MIVLGIDIVLLVEPAVASFLDSAYFGCCIRCSKWETGGGGTESADGVVLVRFWDLYSDESVSTILGGSTPRVKLIWFIFC
jgi:hypothetical protein